MKAVQVSARAASALGDNLIGVKLIREAFAPDAGPLPDVNAEGGERVGRMEVFAGAIASYKNPHSHQDVNLDNPCFPASVVVARNPIRLSFAKITSQTRSPGTSNI